MQYNLNIELARTEFLILAHKALKEGDMKSYYRRTSISKYFSDYSNEGEELPVFQDIFNHAISKGHLSEYELEETLKYGKQKANFFIWMSDKENLERKIELEKQIEESTKFFKNLSREN